MQCPVLWRKGTVPPYCLTQLCCDKATLTENHHLRVIVIAGSSEGLVALARLINSLPSKFPVPLVACIRGLHDAGVVRLVRRSLDSPSGLIVVAASEGGPLLPGHLYLAQAGSDVVFTAAGVLGIVPAPGLSSRSSPTDRLFESAARFHGRSVIGVVLSGKGEDGTRGLVAIFHAGGISVVQSPSEAGFPSMPFNALLGDHVQHLVMLDQMGTLLARLVEEPHPQDLSYQGPSL
jgi:two-component system chemotaxis response regulator CheB